MADEFNLAEHDIPQDVPEVVTSSGHVISIVTPMMGMRTNLEMGKAGRYLTQPDDPCLYYTAQPKDGRKY